MSSSNFKELCNRLCVLSYFLDSTLCGSTCHTVGAASFIYVYPVIEKSALFNPSPFSYYIPLYEMYKQHYPTILLFDYYEKVDEKSFFIRVIFKEVGVVWGGVGFDFLKPRWC